MTEASPRSAPELTAALRAGETVRSIAARYGRSPATVYRLARQLGVTLGRPGRRKRAVEPAPRQPRPRPEIPADLTGSITWPADAEMIHRLVDAGFSDSAAARLFGIRPSTFKVRRRRTIGPKRLRQECPAPAPAEYGFDPAAVWPPWCVFEDATLAPLTGRLARCPLPPATSLPTASSIAF